MNKKLLFILSLLVAFSLNVGLNAQTVLSAGDIAIVRMNEDSPSDGFSFVSLTAISAGTEIYFTEQGWLNTTWIGNTESHLKYTTPVGGLSAGSVVHIDETATGDVLSVTGAGGTITFAWSTSGFNLSSGDQMLVYQTSSSSKPTSIDNFTFIGGLTLNDGNGSDIRNYNDPTTHWTVSTYAELGLTGVDKSTLPTGLTNATNCISVFPDFNSLAEKDNARYNCTLTSGTKSQLLAAINNHDNWLYDDATNYATSSVCSFNISTATITFTNGSSFNQSITPGSSNQILGRFQLTGNISGSYFTAASIKLNGTRSGLSNFKLWSSSDASFGGDTQIGSTVVADPGDGNSVSFSSFSNTISTSETYYFLTADVSVGASGTVQGVIVQNSSLTISEDDGSISGTINNSVLSNSTAALPVELSSFTANTIENKVTLNWQTATEVNNYGFEIERSQNNNWEKIGFVEGHGNSNSPKDYSFTDKPINGSDFKYRLKQVDFDGNFEFSPEIEVSLIVPQFSVKQNYPNPFNPSTKIEFSIPKSGNVKLSIFNAIGQEVAVLINENMEAGNHNFQFSSDNYQLSSGIYFYKVISGKYSETKKMILLR